MEFGIQCEKKLAVIVIAECSKSYAIIFRILQRFEINFLLITKAPLNFEF